MGGFMGTPPAPAQPPQVNFTTTAESRGGFNNFLRSIPSTTAMTPIPPMGSSPMPPMANPMNNIDIFNPPQNFLSGGLVQFGNDLMRSLAEPVNEKTRNIGPFLNVIEDSAQQRFGVDLSSLNNQNQNPFSPTGSIFQPPKAPDGMGGGMGISSNPDSIFTPSYDDFREETDLTGGAQLAYMQMDPDGDGLDTFGKPMRESTSSGGMSLGDSKKLFNNAFTQGASGSSSSAFGGGDSRVAGQMAGMSSLASGIGGMPQMFYNGGEVDDSDFGGFSDYSSVDAPSDYSDFSGSNNYDDSDPDQDMDYTDSYDTKEDQEADFSAASEIGQAVAQAQAASNEIQNRALAAQNKANINQAINQNKANQQSLIDTQLSLAPSKSGTTTTVGVSPNNSNVQASTNTNFSNIGVKGDDDPLGLSLQGVGLGPSINTPSIASVSPTSGPNTNADITGFGSGRDKSDFSTDIDALSNVEEQAKKGSFPNLDKVPGTLGVVTGLINAATKRGAQNTIDNISKGFAPTYDKDGNITGTTNYGIGMGQPGGLFGSGTTVDNYDVFDKTSPSLGMYDDNEIGGDDNDNPLLLRKPIVKPIEEDDGDKLPNIIGGEDPDVGIPTPPQSVVVDSPFTSNVSKYTPVGFDGGDLNALLAALLKTSNPQSMAQGGVAGYAEGGLINAVDNFLASV